MKAYPYEMFTYNKEDRTFICEASDLQFGDYYPVEIWIRGKRETVSFVFFNTEIDGEGELQLTRYIDVKHKCELVVLND